MNDMEEFARNVNRAVDATLLLIKKEVSDLKNGYIVRICNQTDEITELKAKKMFLEEEIKRCNSSMEKLEKYRECFFWTVGSLGIILIAVLTGLLLF